ncbi:hypothetical protein Avbf_15400 [Armadillidium vulgare]|nr:hypothetical protein Avbf_15400 [Armadillidium vulgare]
MALLSRCFLHVICLVTLVSSFPDPQSFNFLQRNSFSSSENFRSFSNPSQSFRRWQRGRDFDDSDEDLDKFRNFGHGRRQNTFGSNFGKPFQNSRNFGTSTFGKPLPISKTFSNFGRTSSSTRTFGTSGFGTQNFGGSSQRNFGNSFRTTSNFGRPLASLAMTTVLKTTTRAKKP